MNLGRNPILLVIALFFLLFIVLNIVNHKSSTSLSDTDRAVRTKQALTRVMNAEENYFTKNKKYADHLSDLIPIDKDIAKDLTDGVATIQLDSSGDKVYFLAVTSPVLSFTRTVRNGQIITRGCLQLKSAGDKYCKRKTSDVKKTIPVARPQIGQ